MKCHIATSKIVYSSIAYLTTYLTTSPSNALRANASFPFRRSLVLNMEMMLSADTVALSGSFVRANNWHHISFRSLSPIHSCCYFELLVVERNGTGPFWVLQNEQTHNRQVLHCFFLYRVELILPHIFVGLSVSCF